MLHIDISTSTGKFGTMVIFYIVSYPKGGGGDELVFMPDDHGDREEFGGHMKKLEVVHVHKEVGGCLISYNLQLACIRNLEAI